MKSLEELVGTFPVRAHPRYDKDNNKFVADYYIPSNRAGTEVRYVDEDWLACWCQDNSISIANSIIRGIYELEIPDGKATVPETMAKQLVKKGIIKDVSWYDDGIAFQFPNSKLETYSKRKILNLKKAGRSFKPLSKNAGW